MFEAWLETQGVYVARRLLFCVGLAAFVDIRNISLSDYEEGAEFVVQCRIETCIPDMVVQLFKGQQLVDMETLEEGKGFVGRSKVKATSALVGDYLCQGMSEKYNEVFRQSFSITGGFVTG